MPTIKLVAGVLVALVLSTLTFSAATPPAAASDGQATYIVEITNTTTGQYLTPPNWAAHAAQSHVFRLGHAPSDGVSAVAEMGGVPVLADELQSAIDDAGLGTSGIAGGDLGPIEPGGSRTLEFTSDQPRFSFVSMIVCTNDGFGGIDARRLPTEPGQSKTWKILDYDAGTELNTENRADLVPAPFCDGPGGTGEDQPEIDESGIIKRHSTLTGVGDLPLSFDWDRGSVGNVTVTRVDELTNYSVMVQNLTPGQYFTPLNFAAHNSAVDVFSVGNAPTAGLAAVAEAGDVAALAAELHTAVDAAGLGVSGVAAAPAGPIAPGESRHFDFTSAENRLSIVSMIVCTNDGFAGLDGKTLPGGEGESRTYYLRAFDAGAEMNTELRADLVPAPFCGGPGGTAGDQPEIDGAGVIRPHPTLRGVGDIPLTFDWNGPVLAVTVTNNG